MNVLYMHCGILLPIKSWHVHSMYCFFLKLVYRVGTRIILYMYIHDLLHVLVCMKHLYSLYMVLLEISVKLNFKFPDEPEIFRSPNFPEDYPSNFNHTWNLTVSFGSVHIRVNVFSVQGSTHYSCQQDDWVKVRMFMYRKLPCKRLL